MLPIFKAIFISNSEDSFVVMSRPTSEKDLNTFRAMMTVMTDYKDQIY